MVVQHNMQAMNANRMLGVTTGSQAKSTEKLSSGYKINRAADDAAGLSISEKMRKQIRGLSQASDNAQDGISCVQTAEGALTEVHDMLQRMNELAVKASNGTMSKDDRQNIQDEISQLTTEIDRVSETTKFNETYLLKGNGNTSTNTLAAHDAGFAGKLTANTNGTSTFQLDSLKVGDKISIAGKKYEIGTSKLPADYAQAAATPDSTYGGTTVVAGDVVTKADGTKQIVGDGKNGTTAVADVALNKGDTVSVKATGKDISIVSNGYTPTALSDVETAIKAVAAAGTVKIGSTTYTVAATTSSAISLTADDIAKLVKNGDEVEIGTNKMTVIDAADDSITINDAYTKIAKELETASSIGSDTKASVVSNGAGNFTITQGTVNTKEDLSIDLHVGADADSTNKIGMNIASMNVAGLGVKDLDIVDETGTAATYAIDAITDAVKAVSSQRSALGAVQNRLEHTINNLDNVVENTTAAESAIRDTDMASEMVAYSKNNILSQAGQSMLAQANQSTQGVLSLLQ
ncbi:MAG: flagellin [Lachnospiraceae bacterium]|nr:flagellin [Lachnospiraceae bacterium]